ncbi:MAG: glucose/galactose MFS transporter, partial [Cellulophaga baltica]
GLGKFTERGSALLIMAISGGAILPLLYGSLVDNKKETYIASAITEASATAQAATFGYWILVPCYLFILYYAFWGHKTGSKKN